MPQARTRSFRNSPTAAWSVCLIVVYALYTVVPLLFFNDRGHRVAGMPAMLFWFTLLPWIIPAMMFALYVIDGRMMQRLAEESADE